MTDQPEQLALDEEAEGWSDWEIWRPEKRAQGEPSGYRPEEYEPE